MDVFGLPSIVAHPVAATTSITIATGSIHDLDMRVSPSGDSGRS
jgi:hypothetical protein